jgi:outer membrane protein assembly factor BamB
MKAPTSEVFKKFLILIPLLLLSSLCFSQTIVLSPQTGPPTTKTLVSGSGFPAFGAIDIYFDTASAAKANADSVGAFSKVAIVVPSSARPGKHWVSAMDHFANASAQVSFLVRTNWSQFGFSPDRVSVNPYENVLSPTTVGRLGLKWTSFSSGAQLCGGPTVVDGVAYVAGWDDNVYALNASTGAKLWSFFSGDLMCSTPAVVGGVVYLGSYSSFFAFNAKTGAQVWSFPRPTPGPSTVLDGVVYFVSGNYGNGDVFALNAKTGAEIWRYHNGADTLSSPAVANGKLYFGDTNGLHALNAKTGTLLWNFPAGNLYGNYPVVANGVVYTGSDNHTVYAVNASTGAKLWSFTSDGNVSAVANGVVYVTDRSSLYALNAGTGATLWSNTDGLYEMTSVANGVLYVGSSDHNVYAFNAKTGAKLWSFLAPDGVGEVRNPTVSDGVLYLTVSGGTIYDPAKVYAFGLPADTTPPVTTASVSGTKGDNGWYKGPVVVTLGATDPKSAVAASYDSVDGSAYPGATSLSPDCRTVAATYYSVDGCAYQPYKAPFTIKGDGVHPLLFYSVDPAGNREKAHKLTIKIDATSPIVGVAANPSVLWPPNGKMINVFVTGSIADSTSGVNPSSVTFSVTDEYGLIQPKGQVTLIAGNKYTFSVSLQALRRGNDKDGRIYTVVVRPRDLAGNTSGASATVTVPHDRRR